MDAAESSSATKPDLAPRAKRSLCGRARCCYHRLSQRDGIKLTAICLAAMGVIPARQPARPPRAPRSCRVHQARVVRAALPVRRSGSL